MLYFLSFCARRCIQITEVPSPVLEASSNRGHESNQGGVAQLHATTPGVKSAQKMRCVSRVSILGILFMVSGRYLVFG